MEANICDINHLESDVLLPPRKRLLVGLKRQSNDADVSSRVSSVVCSSSSGEFDTPLNNLLKCHGNNPDLSLEEIAEASSAAAIAAVKVAEAARAAAEERAVIAAKAIAAAKSALDLVASFPDEEAYKERYLKKNKLKKQVQVQLLYKKHKPVKNFKRDEELARKLHRAINSSPRVSKNSSESNTRSHKHKKLKRAQMFAKSSTLVGAVAEEGSLPVINGNAAPNKVKCEGALRCLHNIRIDNRVSNFDKAQVPEMDGRDAETNRDGDKFEKDTSVSGKKRGRTKLKMLPLSTCTFKDQESPKKDVITTISTSTEINEDNPMPGKMPLLPQDTSIDTVMPNRSKWKCQGFKATACMKQNKVMQS